MTIAKTIELLVKLQIDDLPLPRHEEWQAVQLGIEALKDKQEARRYNLPSSAILLPGETVDPTH